MPERPRPDLDRVRDALEEHDERISQPTEPEPAEPKDDDEEDDGDA